LVSFLQRAGYNRYLHSFPTRRSSDLPCPFREDYEAPPEPVEREHAAEREVEPVEAGPLEVASQQDQPGENVVRHDEHPPPARRPDRKSTRLNSSHVAISYAVFCLKKK